MMEKVTDFIYRGKEPRKIMKGLAEQGIKETLMLQSGWFDITDGELYEVFEIGRAHGIIVNPLPFSDFRHPTAEQTLKALHVLDRAIKNENKIYVHCLHGVDRTGWVIAAYRVSRQHWSVDAAVDEWKKKGFHSWWYFWWEKAFRKMYSE